MVVKKCAPMVVDAVFLVEENANACSACFHPHCLRISSFMLRSVSKQIMRFHIKALLCL
jgi:hypothetical protein